MNATMQLVYCVKTKKKGRMKQVSVALGLSDDGGRTWKQEFDEAVSLSYTARLIGFISLFSIGWILNILGAASLTTGNLKLFAIYYSMGNILTILSTCFLFGPCGQIKRMFDPIRIWATLVYLAAIVATIIVAVKYGQVGPVLACLLFQFCAMVYYSFSYIPYGREMLRSCVCAPCR